MKNKLGKEFWLFVLILLSICICAIGEDAFDPTALRKSRNLADLPASGTARTNLGIPNHDLIQVDINGNASFPAITEISTLMVGTGAIDPLIPLEVKRPGGGDNAQFSLKTADRSYLIQNFYDYLTTDFGLSKLVYTATGKIGIGTSTPASDFHLIGDQRLSGRIYPLNGEIQIGVVDPYGRTQIWNKAANSVLRLGSLEQDGDPAPQATSEGIVIYGANSSGTFDNDDWAYARIKPNRIGLLNTISNNQVYIFRVDHTDFYLKDDSGNKTFSINRYNGNVSFSGTINGVSGSGIASTAALTDLQSACNASHSLLVATDTYLQDQITTHTIEIAALIATDTWLQTQITSNTNDIAAHIASVANIHGVTAIASTATTDALAATDTYLQGQITTHSLQIVELIATDTYLQDQINADAASLAAHINTPVPLASTTGIAGINGSSTQDFAVATLTVAQTISEGGTLLSEKYRPIAYDRKTIVTTDSTTEFSTGLSYYASGTILVFVGGMLQEPGTDYEETSVATITFLSPVASGTRVTIMRR